MTFLEEAFERGFIKQCTDMIALEEHMKNQTLAYIGFDCTADCLHVGSLIQLMMFRLLEKHGHLPIVLLGGATTKIGDPSGKDTSRKMLSDDEIDLNTFGITKCIDNFIPGIGRTNNSTWMDKLHYMDILQEVGTHFTINRMMTMDSVKTRLEKENPMTFLEFNYIIFQSYDFLKLLKSFGVTLQIGGSDQWGNIVSGVDLIRRVTGKQVFGLTTPLLLTSSGKKMGKSENGAIWLSKDKTSVFDYWQFWRNIDDNDVERFLKLFTELSLYDVEKIMEGDINQAKIILATEATTIAHGKDEAILARDHAISKEPINFNFDSVVEEQTQNLLYKLLVALGQAKSGNDAKRLISGKAVKINNELITDEYYSCLGLGNEFILSVGKKSIYRIQK